MSGYTDGDGRKELSDAKLPALSALEGADDVQQFTQSLFEKDTVGQILKAARIIQGDTGYGQINLIVSPKGVEHVCHQTWWKDGSARNS